MNELDEFLLEFMIFLFGVIIGAKIERFLQTKVSEDLKNET